MAKELIRYRDGKPALQDGLIADDLSITCGQCEAEYRVHYSAGEINRPNGLEALRSAARGKVNESHSLHPDSIFLG